MTLAEAAARHAILLCPPRGRRFAKVEARVSHLFIKPAHGAPMEPRAAVRAVSGHGLDGDAAFGTSRRQVLLLDDQTLTEFDLTPGLIRENITVSGMRLNGIARGAQLHIGEVILEITGDCTPCDFLDQLRPGLRQAIAGRRGVLARVARGGDLALGEVVHLLATEPTVPPSR